MGDGDVRVSDADREAVVDRLRQGCTDGRLTVDEFAERVGGAYAARTAAELDRLTADLPAPAARPDAAPAVPTGQPTRWVVGVLGNGRRQGRWRPAVRTWAVAVLGGCLVDLSEADLDGPVDIRAVGVMGGVDVIVPDGADVELRGVAVLGGKHYRVRPGAGANRGSTATVTITARVVFGGVTVRNRLPRPTGR